MMNLDEPENVAVQKPQEILPPPPKLKVGLTEVREYRADVTWPSLTELQVPEAFKQEHADFYKTGPRFYTFSIS